MSLDRVEAILLGIALAAIMCVITWAITYSVQPHISPTSYVKKNCELMSDNHGKTYWYECPAKVSVKITPITNTSKP